MRTEFRKQNSDDRGPKSEFRRQRSEVRNQKSDFSVFCLLSSVFCLLSSISAFATDLAPIQVTGREEASAASAGASTTVIRPEKYEKQFKTIPEVLEETPGITVRQAGGLGQLSTVSIRGSSAEQVAVFLDGVRLNTAAGGAVDFSTLPLNQLEKIEVIRGAGAHRFGSGSVGGVILLHTKKIKERQLHFDASAGSFWTLKTNESWMEPGEQDSFSLNHTHLSSKGNFSFQNLETSLAGVPLGNRQTYTRENNAFYSENLLFKWDRNISETISTTTHLDTFFTDREIPGTAEEQIQLSPANPLEAKEKLLRQIIGTRWKLNEYWTFEASNHFEWDHFKDPSPALGSAIDTQSHNNGLVPALQWKKTYDEEKFNLILTSRYDFRWDSFKENGRSGHDRTTHAALLDTEIALFKDKLIFSPAIRYEDASDFKDRWIGKMGVEQWITPNAGLHAHLQQSFRYPTFNELYFPDQGYIRGNPALSSEESLNWDAGLFWRRERFSFETSYFHHDIDNSILFVPISAFTIEPRNTLAATEKGFETDLQVDASKWLRLTANYTWLTASFDSTRSTLPGRSKHTLYAKSEFMVAPVSFYTDLRYRSRFPINVANTTFLTDRYQINTGVTYHYKKWYSTTEMKNILNTQIYDNQGFPLPRRSFFVTIGADV